MNRSAYKTGTLLLLTLLLLPLAAAAQEATKDFHQEWNAGANTTLNINNKYGEVLIDSWDQNQVVIDVKVTVDVQDKERAEKLIEYINVEFTQEGDVLSARTVIDDNFNFKGWRGPKKFSINYKVRMPVSSSLALTNRYGNTVLDELDGHAKFDIRYGNLNATKLTRGKIEPLNNIMVQYGDLNLDEAGWVDLYLRYVGKAEIGKSQAMLLDAKYSRVNIQNTSSVVGNFEYNTMNIGTINNLVLDNRYAEVNIDRLGSKLQYDGKYGKLDVEDIPADFKMIEVVADYSGVDLGINGGANYDLIAKVRYGGVNYDEGNFTNRKRVIENNSQEIEGRIGKNETPEAKVNITASYTSVNLR